MARNPFADPFTNPESGTAGFDTMSPAMPRRVVPSMEDADSPQYEPTYQDSLLSDEGQQVPEVEPFVPPYVGEDLLSEPMKGQEPTAFQRKQINWDDGGEDLTRPRLRDVAPSDWLEVDYMHGKKEGASDAPVEAANVFGRQFTRDELMQDEEGRNLLALMEYRRSGKVNEGGALARFGKGFSDVSVADIPFYGWFADIGTTIGEAIDMSKTIRKLQDGDKVSTKEAIRLRSYMLRQELESQRSMAYNVGSTVRSSVSLGAEILASSAVGAGIGAMFGGVGAPVGAVAGALLAPLRWVFGVGGKAAKAGARKVVNVGMKALAEKAAKDLTGAEIKSITKAGVGAFGREGMAAFLRQEAKKGLGRRGVYQSVARELQYATKMTDPTRMATRALFSADYRLALEEGLRTAVEEKALGRTLSKDVTKDAIAKMTFRDRRRLVNEGIQKMMKNGEWKEFTADFAKGVSMGDKTLAADFVRKGVQEATGRGFVSPQYAQKMLDIVAGNVVKDMEIQSGRLAFANPVRLYRYFGEHVARGLVQSEHALFGGAPTIAHKGFTTFARGSDALKEGVGRVFIEAPVQGVLQFAGGPLMLSPIFAAASGHSPLDLTVRGQLGMEIDALMRGDRDKMDTARMCALGSAFVEYASEAAGRGLGLMTGGAVATALRKSPKAVAEGAKAMVEPVSRRTGAALDRAVKAVFGEGDLMKNGAEGFVNQTLRQIRKMTGRSGVRASVLRAVQTKSLDGFDDLTRQAFAKKGVTSWTGLEKFIAREVADGNRMKGALNYFGMKLMERGMTPDRVVQFFRQAGYHGVLEEMGEERVGDFMRGLFGFDDTASDATWKDKLKSMFSGFTDFDQLGTELLAFSIPGAVRRGVLTSQHWLANGAVGQARGAVQGLKYMAGLGRGKVYTAVGGVTQEDKARFEAHPAESAKMRDGILGTAEENRAKMTANAGAAYAGVDSLRDTIVKAGGLSAESGAEKADAGVYEGMVSGVLGATSEGHMKTAMNELADQLLALGDEASLETAIEQTGAEVVFGKDGVDAIRREWRKVAGHEFSADSEIEKSLSVPVNGNAVSWKEFDAQRLTVTRKSVDTPEGAVDDMCAQIAGVGRNASVSAEQEERANGSEDALVADENARDVAVEDGMTLGRFLGRGAIRANAKMGFGRRCVSRIVGLLGAATTGDLSLAATSPAAWLAEDEGIDKNLQTALLKCYSAGIMSGWARLTEEQGAKVKELVGEATTAEELRDKLASLIKEGRISEDLYDELERLGEDTYRARVSEFMTAYMTASGVALVTRQDALDMARSIVAKRHEKSGEKFDRNDEWYAREDVAREVEEVRSDVIDGVIATARNSLGYTTHAGQGMYGTYMTVDVARAIKNGTSAEILAAILDSPAFRGVSRVQNVSGLSEHERELANSLMYADNLDLGAIASIQTEGEIQADGTYADRELTERELTEVNAAMKANPSDYTPEAFQNLARTFVRRIRLTRENMRSTFSKYDEDGNKVTVRVVPMASGGFDLVQTDESGVATRSHMGGDRAGVESYLALQGYSMEEQRLVISQLRSFASSDATSLLFMRYGQDREAVRDVFKNSAGEIEDETMLPPFCRKVQREADGPLEWLYDESMADVAAEQFRKELALADEYDHNRDTWRYYLAGTGANEGARKARMAEAKKMYLRVYGIAGSDGASGGYESRARETIEALGIRRSASAGTEMQMAGLPANAYVMNVDAMSADNVLVLAPDYFTLGHGEAMLRHGIRQALNVYVAGNDEEARLRSDLLVEAYREFRESAAELVAEAEAKPGGHAEAERLRRVFDEMLPVRETGVTTQDLAKMASSAVFFSCDRGNYEDGNGFLHSTELSQVADRFRSKDVFQFFLSAVDEALGGTGVFNVNRNNAGGLARYLQAFAPDFAKLAKARMSAAFGGESGVAKAPFISGFRLRQGVGAEEFKNNPGGKWVERDPGVGVRETTSDRLRVASFDGKIAGYWATLVTGGQKFAQAYEGLVGGKDTVLSTARAFEMARRSDFCGGEAKEPASSGTRARMSDVVTKLAREEVGRLTELPDVGDISPKSLEGAGQAFRLIANNLSMLSTPATEAEVSDYLAKRPGETRENALAAVRRKREAQYLREFKGWLLGRNVPDHVASAIVAAFDDAITRPIVRKTDEEAKDEAADRANREAEEAERNDSTNDPDHEVRVAAFVNDQDIVAISGFLKFLMPAERGDSSPTFCRLRQDLCRPEMYGDAGEWTDDVRAFTDMLGVNFNLADFGRRLAANRVNLAGRGEVDRMLDRVSTLLWRNGHRDYALAVAAIRNVDPANGARGKMLEMLAQATPVTPMFLKRVDPKSRTFDIDFIGSQTRSHVIPSVVAAGYVGLAESSLLKGLFKKDGSINGAGAAKAIASAVARLRSPEFAAEIEAAIGAKGVKRGKWIGSGVAAKVSDMPVDEATYEVLRETALGLKPHSLAEYTEAVNRVADVLRERMRAAAGVLDSLLGTGNQYSYMLTSPYAADALARQALAAYNVKGADRKAVNTRSRMVNDFVSLANYFVADPKAGAKTTWKTRVQRLSGVVEDLVAEPVIGLVRRLGVDPAAADLESKVAEALQGRGATWVRETLRSMAKEKLRSDMHLDLGVTAREAYSRLGNNAKFVPGAMRTDGNLRVLVGAYLAASPRSSSTLGGRAANAAEGAKQKSVQTLPSALPGFVRFANSELCAVSGAAAELQANGSRWRDGSSPVVSFVGAKDVGGRLLRKESLAGVLDAAIQAKLEDPDYSMTHVLVPFFRADKPSCYALRIPVATMRDMIAKGSQDEDVMRQLPADLQKTVLDVAKTIAAGEEKVKDRADYNKAFYKASYALAASALGQSQIDPKRVPVLVSVGPVISTYVDEGENTDPRAGCYFVSNVGGVTGASLMGGYITAGVLPSRVSGMGEGKWSQAQKLHMFSVMRGVNFKKGQASAVGLGFYEGRSDDRSQKGEIQTSGAIRYAQACGRRALERVLSEDFRAANLSGSRLLDPVAPLKDGATDEERKDHEEKCHVHDRAVDIANSFLSRSTVAVDDLETNKAGLFGSSCGIALPDGADRFAINGVEIMHLEDGKWVSSVGGFEFDFDGEGVKKGKVLLAPALAALAVATDGTVNAGSVEAEWVRPDGSRFAGTLAESGLLGPGEKLSFRLDRDTGSVQMAFFTREIYGQVVANNANSSKATLDHVFPTNATRDHWMLEEIVNDVFGGRRGSRRFLDAHSGYSLLQLANLAHNQYLVGRELRRDADLVALFAKHPNDNQVRDAISNRVRAFYEKQTVVGFYGNHGVMVPSGAKLVDGDEFSHIVRIEWAPGTTDYDRDCLRGARVFTKAEAAAYGTSRSWPSALVNADVPGFRYGLCFDETTLDALLADVEVPAEKDAVRSAFDKAGADAKAVDRMLRLEAFMADLSNGITSPEQVAKRHALLSCAYDYTGRKASENVRARDIRFDDLFYRTWDGQVRFDYAAFDLSGRVSKHDGARHFYMGGSPFHAHRSPSGNVEAAAGTARASAPVSYKADGSVGSESKYALDPVTTATQGSDTDGDSASLQFYDYGAEDLVDEASMRQFTDAVLGGADAFAVAKNMGWTTTVDGDEVVDPRVLRSVQRLVFVAQCSNFREFPTFHQGYCGVEGLEGRDGGDFAEYYGSHAPAEGYEFADYGFAGRHPVGTDAVWAEPLADESLSRLNAMLSPEAKKRLGADFAGKWLVGGKKMNKVLEAAVDAFRGSPDMRLLDPTSVASTSDAASDSAKARGISVANQSMFMRELVVGLGSSGVPAWSDGYSAGIDLIAHVDGVSNNLFDTLKKMFATRAGWTSTMLPFFLGRLAGNADAAPGGRLDSAYVLAQAVNFLEELTRVNKNGTSVTLAGRVQSLLDPVRGDAVARNLAERFNKGRKDGARKVALRGKETASEVIDKFLRVKYEDESEADRANGTQLAVSPFSMSRDEKVIRAACYMADEANLVKDVENLGPMLRAAQVADDSKAFCSAIDYMKVAGKGLADVGRIATRATELDTWEKENERHPLTEEGVEKSAGARLQDLVVRRFASQIAKSLDSSELLQAAIDGQIGRRPWDFASGSALRENYDRFVHLIGAVKACDRGLVERISVRGSDVGLPVEFMSEEGVAEAKATPKTQVLVDRIAATVRFYSDKMADMSEAPRKVRNADGTLREETPAEHRVRLLLRRLFISLEVPANRSSISLAARESSADIDELREAFDVLAVSADSKFTIMDFKGSGVEATDIVVTGRDLARLLVLHASLTGTYGASQDYVTQSNLPAVFGDRRLAKLERFRPEILSSYRLTSALGLKPVEGSGVTFYDIFGTVDTYERITKDVAENVELPYLRRQYEAATDANAKKAIARRGKDLADRAKADRNLVLQRVRSEVAYDILAGGSRDASVYGGVSDGYVLSPRDVWTSATDDPISGLMKPDEPVGEVSASEIGLSVEEKPSFGQQLVDRAWAEPLATRTEFPGLERPFRVPVVEEDGRLSRTKFRPARTLESAYNMLLCELIDAAKKVPSRVEARNAFAELNPGRPFLTYDAGRVTRELANILSESARRVPELYDALDRIGDRLVRHPDPRVAAAFNLANSRVGREGPNGILRPTAQTRASFMGGDTVDTRTRAEFIDHAEAVRPGFTDLQARSVREAVKGAFESAFDGSVVTTVLDKDGNETNLMKVERAVSGRKIVTYVSYGSRMGETLDADAAAESLAEAVNARAAAGVRQAPTESMRELLERNGDVDAAVMEMMTDGTVLETEGGLAYRYDAENDKWLIRTAAGVWRGGVDDKVVARVLRPYARPAAVTGADLVRRLGADAIVRMADLMRRTGGQAGESVVDGLDFAPAMSGIIRLSDHANFTTLFHEYYHQMVAVYRKLGILDRATEDGLNAALGGEERAAEAFGRYLAGVENGATDVELRDFLKEDGVTEAHLDTFRRFRRYALEFARGSFRGVDEDGVPQFVAVKIVEGRLTEEEVLKVVEPSKADVENLEREILGLESRPRTDVLTGDQLVSALDARTRAVDAIVRGRDADAKEILSKFESSVSAPKPKVQAKKVQTKAAPEALPSGQTGKATTDVCVGRVSAFIRKALTRYASDGGGELAEEMKAYRAFPVTGDASCGPNAALFYTVRSFIAHVAEAENIALYDENGGLTEAGAKLMSSDVVGELALRFVHNAEADRRANSASAESRGVSHASSAWAFSRALQTVAPGSYTRHCRRLAEKSAEAFRRLGETLLSKPGRTEDDVLLANEFLAKSREVGKFVDYIARGQDIRGLLPFDVDAGGNLHGMFMVYFAGSAAFQRTEEGYLYPKGPVRPYSRDLPHTNALSTGDSAHDPLIDLAYNYAAQAFSVAEAARSYNEQVNGRGKDGERFEEDLTGVGDERLDKPLTAEESRMIDEGLQEALGVTQNPEGEVANELAAEAAQIDVNASRPMTEPGEFYSAVDSSVRPEWILANAGQWLASDMQRHVAGVAMRDMMTDHTIRAVTEQQYRLAMDWVQFFGMDTHPGDGVREVRFVESTLGRNAKGDYAIGDDYAHTVTSFSNTRGCLFGIFNWQEKRVGAPIDREDWREIHSVGRLVKLLANRQDVDLTGIDVGFLATRDVVERFRQDDYAKYYSPAALLRRVSENPRYQRTAVEDLLLRVLDGQNSSIVFGDSSKPDATTVEEAKAGLWHDVVEAVRRAVTSAEAFEASAGTERMNDIVVNSLCRARVVHRAASRGVDRAVVCVTTDRMLRAWDGSDARKKLLAAGRPAAMLNPHYWAVKFSKAVGAINAAASKSSYISQGEGSTFTLAGTSRFWWHGGTGSHKVQVEAYQNALRAFDGMTPSDVAVLRAKQATLFDIIDRCDDPAMLQRRAFGEKGDTRLTDVELRYLAHLMGVDGGRSGEARFDVRGFARDIARGRYETHSRDLDVPCTISRNATVLDVRLAICDLVSSQTFGRNLGELPVEQRQEYLDAQTAADMLRERLSREVPAKVTARSELEVFDRTGRLGDSRTAAESLIEMCKELTTAERFRGCLAQMLTSLSADGTPAFVVAPTDAALGIDRMPDEYWGALARHVVRFLGQKFPTLAYDAGLSGAENMRRIHRHLVESDQRLYGKLSTAKYGGDRLFQGDVLCRLDDRDAAGNVDEATRLLGGQAACYMKQLLATLRAPTQSSAWRVLDRISSWSKISSVGFSAFFQIATAFESPVAAVGFLKTLAGQAEWMGKAYRRLKGSDDVFTRDVVRLLNSNDPFLSEARELCDLIGMPLDSTIDFMNDPQDSNPVLGNTVGIKRDIERISAFAERSGVPGLGKSVRKTLEFMYKHPTDYTFNVILNGVKLAVVMQTVRRLREECERGGRPFDLVKEMRRYGTYINAEIGGVDPARYAWTTPGMKKLMSLGMFSWQWTLGAWSAGGGEAISDLIFGGHSTNAELRRHSLMRWIRMFGIVKFGVPAVLQASIKALSMLGLRALPPDPDDPEGDGLEEDVDAMPWWTFNNESKAGMLSFDVTPILKLAARVPGAKALKRADVPVISWAVPAYVGGGRNTTGKRHYYMHFGKQSDEFWRWFEAPMSQFVSKLSIPLQKGVEGFFGRLQPNGFSKGFSDKSLIDRWFTLSLDPDQSALANFMFAMVSSFSLESMKANADAGFIAAVGPMRMGQSKRSTRLRIVERLRKFVEDDRSGNPWSSPRNRRRFNLMCADILREAQVNGIDPKEILSSALGDVAHVEYGKFFSSFPTNLDGAPNVPQMQEAVRALTRIDRKRRDLYSYLVQKFKAAGTDLEAHRAYSLAIRDAIRATQAAPFSFDSETAKERFDRYLARPDQAVRSTQMDAKGGEVFGNFLATDEVPETLFGVPVVTDRYTEEDLEFFREHPEAGGYYETGDGFDEPPEGPEGPDGGPAGTDGDDLGGDAPSVVKPVGDGFLYAENHPFGPVGTAVRGDDLGGDTFRIENRTADDFRYSEDRLFGPLRAQKDEEEE